MLYIPSFPRHTPIFPFTEAKLFGTDQVVYVFDAPRMLSWAGDEFVADYFATKKIPWPPWRLVDTI